MTGFEMVVAVVAALRGDCHVVGLSRNKVVLRYVSDRPFDPVAEGERRIPGFAFRVDPSRRAVARRL